MPRTLKIIILSCWLIATTASAELITGHRISSGFAWDYRYDISMVGDTIHVHNELYLFPVEVTQSEIDAIWPVWEAAIESVWSTADIIFDVTFGAAYDYFVYVIPGRTRNMSVWGLSPGENSGLMAAHEYGHMIGLYDEYKGGATDPAGTLIDPTSIMGSVNHDVQTYPRHYDEIYAWADEQRVPEPGTLILTVLGLLILILKKWKLGGFFTWRPKGFIVYASTPRRNIALALCSNVWAFGNHPPNSTHHCFGPFVFSFTRIRTR